MKKQNDKMQKAAKTKKAASSTPTDETLHIDLDKAKKKTDRPRRIRIAKPVEKNGKVEMQSTEEPQKSLAERKAESESWTRCQSCNSRVKVGSEVLCDHCGYHGCIGCISTVICIGCGNSIGE